MTDENNLTAGYLQNIRGVGILSYADKHVDCTNGVRLLLPLLETLESEEEEDQGPFRIFLFFKTLSSGELLYHHYQIYVQAERLQDVLNSVGFLSVEPYLGRILRTSSHQCLGWKNPSLSQIYTSLDTCCSSMKRLEYQIHSGKNFTSAWHRVFSRRFSSREIGG